MIEICSKKFGVYAVTEVRDNYKYSIPLYDFFRDNISSNKSNIEGLRKLFMRYADNGPAGLTDEMFHRAVNGENAWEFRRGQIRVYGFADGNKIILTHGTLKKTQKTPEEDKEKIRIAREKYFQGDKK